MLHPRPAIDHLLAGSLHPRLERALRRHLRGCASCRRYYDEGASLLAGLSGHPEGLDAETRASLRERILGALPSGEAPAQERPARPGADLLWQWPLVWPRQVVAAGALALLFTLAALWPSAHEPPMVVATIEQAASVRIGGGAGRKGERIPEGAFVEVGEDGMAALRLEVGGVLRAFPGTSFDLRERGKRLRLERGRIWCDLSPQVGRPFEVVTDDAVVTVIGTSFVVERMATGGTDVRVMRGRVRLRDRGGRGGSIEVSAGQRSHVVRGTPPQAPRPYDAEADRSAWQRLWRRLVRALERGLRKVRGYFEQP